VGAKRPREFFARWLADPAQINRHHRMPVFDLSDQEVADLSRYLAERGAGGQAVVAGPADSAAVRKQGAELYQALRCAACHEREANRPQRRPFARGPWPPDGTCLGPPDGAARRPGYRLAAEDQRAVRLYLEDAEAGIGATRDAAARRLEEWNCLACHGREGSPGLAELSEPLLAADGGLHDAWPALWPPSLTGVGHKLHDEALRGAIARRERGRRSWSKVRMPRFPLAEPELNALVRQLVEADRIPPRPDPPPAEPDAAAARTVAARLVTSDGFGCTSCHAIGGSDPPDVALPARGPDLARLGQRVRRSWFDRWVRNPARIVPRMEMPAVQQPVRGVLEDRLDLQLAAIWQVLNEPGFRPPRASPLRVVRSGNDPAAAEGAHYILDLVEAERRAYPRPLLIGLPNRHNLLVDLAAGRLAEWTVGDTARRRTRAKSWYWELAGSSLLPEALREAAGGRADLAVRWSQGGVAEPSVEGQFAFDPDLVEHVADGVRLEHRLRFELGGERLVATVRQTVTALWPGPGSRASGFRRRVEMEGLGDRAALLVRVWPPPGEAYEVRAVSPGARPVDLDSEQWVQAEARSGLAVCELEYLSPLPVDRFAPGPPVDRRLPRQELPVVPGWEAVRLPLTDELMPTGLAWRSDGALVVASLEGRVWLARDSDGDGWHDLAEPVSDELPAPFGVAVRGAEIDLLAKPGLLRLSDFAGGRARRCQTVAAGWGYTGDYHDWAVGLPRDAQGNYYVALPCQQDERSEAAAALRGSIVRLRERPPDRLDPRPYAVELVASGFRFPMGLTLGPEGELFASDNQGNYTPFNELNHVVPGRRYGFLNRLEVRRRLRPGDQRAAVEIPHPWTRSVNGLCYLGGPSGVVDDTARKWFGPWAGHLVGCEYDTRRLVRLSLERVQGEFQGAVYPLSRDPLPGEPTFEGPMTCAVAPDGALFVGNLRDSGWGAGANTGSIVRLAPRGELPAGIAEVRAVADGWLLEFTVPVDRQWAAQATSYTVASYRREATADYGGPDLDRRREAVLSAQVAEDGRRVHLRLGELREGYVYELAVRSLVRSGPWFPDQAHYTLRRRPR
jgi:mono/diheme cytochrome c family protein